MEVKRCCIFFTPRTGTLILGGLGLFVFSIYLVPQTMVLKNHSYHMNQFVKSQRIVGGQYLFCIWNFYKYRYCTQERIVSDVKDEDIPAMISFNKVISSVCVVFGALFIVSSILMLVGVTTSRKYLLIPWLVVTYITLFGR